MLAQAAEAAKYRGFITAAAAQFGIPVCVVCGIGSRESHWGLALSPRGPAGTGDKAPRHPKPPLRTGPMPPDGQGYGRGLMQIDFDSQPFAQTGNWKDAQANIHQGCLILSQSIHFFASKPALSVSPLRAGIAAYNRGPGGILADLQKGLDVDANTAHADYSKDVLNRAGWFQAAGW
jgi:hypothetical protein